MAIAFRAVASTTYAARTNTSVNKPTGTVDNDIMVMSIVSASATSQAATLAVTAPAGWTQLGTAVSQTQSGGGFHGAFFVYWKRASSEGSSYAFTHASLNTQATILSYSGCLTSGSPVDAFSQNADLNTDGAATGVTTTVANTMLVLCEHGWDGGGALTPPSGMTERFDGLVYNADEARAATGATGGRSHVVNVASSPVQDYLIALKPATAAAFSLSAAAGSYAMTGTAAVPKHGWKPAAAVGSYAMTGTAATPTKSTPFKSLTALAGSYAMTGTAATFKSNRNTVALAGSYALTGTAASLTKTGGSTSLPTFRAAANSTYGSTTTSVTCSKPSGTLDGDIMVATLFQGRTGSTPLVPTPPTGWTQIGSYTIPTDGNFDGRCSVWWKRAASEGTSYAWALAETVSTQLAIVAYSNCVASGNPVDVASTSTADFGGPLTATATGVTIGSNNTKLIYTGHNWDNTQALDPPTGMTERFDGLVYFADEDRPNSGATGNRTQTVASSGAWSAYLVALRGATSAGKSLTALGGSYAMTGTAATFRSTRNVVATAGSYAMTGTPPQLLHLSGVGPVFRALASVGYASRTGTTTVTKPTGTVDGDIMVSAFFAAGGVDLDIVLNAAPAGWTQIGTTQLSTNANNNFFGRLWVFWKRALSEGASYDFTHTNTLSTQAAIASYSGGVQTGPPIHVFSQAFGLDGTATATSVTTTVSSTKLLYVGHNWDGTQTLSPPSGMTERFDDILYFADEDRPAPGSTGDRTQTLASVDPWQAYMITLLPPVAITPFSSPPFNPAAFLPFLVR